MIIDNEEFWSVTKSLDDQFIFELQEHFEANKKAFLVLPIKSFYYLDKYNMFLYIEKWNTALSFVNDPKVLKRFEKLGLEDEFIKWFIPLEKILSAFNELEKNTEIKIMKGPALGLIRFHLNAKIRAELFQWGRYITEHRGNSKTNELYKSFINIYRQRKNGEKISSLYKDEYNRMMHQIIDKFEKELPDDVNKEKFFKELSQGKSEPHFLKMMIDECIFKPKKMTHRSFLIHLFDLLRILIKDFEMQSEEDYDNREDGDDEYVNYKTYKYKRVKTIIYRK